MLDYDLKPLWVEKILDNDGLLSVFNTGMKLRETIFGELEYVIKLEKHNPQLKGELSRLAVTALLKNELIVKRLLQKFAEDHYFSTGFIDMYLEKIGVIKDKVREITIRENLGGMSHDI